MAWVQLHYLAAQCRTSTIMSEGGEWSPAGHLFLSINTSNVRKGSNRSGFQTLRAELADAQRTVRAKANGSEDQPLGFSLAMFEHASRYTDIYRALVGGRGGIVAVNEIRQILSELVRKEQSAAQGERAVSRELVVQFVVGTFLTVLTWWLERKPGLPPPQVDAMFRGLVISGIASSIDTKSRHGGA